MPNSHYNFAQYPFIRLLLPLLGGIVWQNLAVPFLFSAGVACIVIFVLLVVWQVSKLNNSFHYQWIWGVGAFILLFFMGVGLVQQQKKQSSLPDDASILIKGVVYKHPQVREKSVRVDLQLTEFKDSCWQRVNEPVILYFSNSPDLRLPKAGDVLLCKTRLQLIILPSNPNEFNYRRYMAQRGVFASAFIPANQYKIVDSNALPWYKTIPLQIQAYVVNSLNAAQLMPNEKGVAATLTIGDKQFLDPDLKQAYASAGVIHLLAVSGLHVGIIYWALSLLLGFVCRFPKGKLIYTILIVVLLWLYAMVVGLAPSVVRATLMLSFVIVGQLFGKPRYTYNFIAASAFILCLFNPYCIFDVGFQLSYSAVLGIIYFSPKIYNLLYVRQKLFDKIWLASSVTLAAQLTTLPIVLYYFNQFPTYFLLANLLLIAFVSCLLYATILLVILHALPFLGELFGYVVNKGLQLVNYVVLQFEALPYSIIGGIYISTFQAWVLIAAIIILALYWALPKAKTAMVGLSLLIVFMTVRVCHYHQLNSTALFAVYNVPNSSFIAFINGDKGFCLRDSASVANNFDYQTKSHLARRGFTNANDLTTYTICDTLLQQYKDFMYVDDRILMFANQQNYSVLGAGTFSFLVDFLFVSNTSSDKPHRILAGVTPRYIIADSSVPRWKAKLWQTEAEKLGVVFYYVKDEGAFVYNFQKISIFD